MDLKPQDDVREVYLRRIRLCRETLAGLRERIESMEPPDIDYLLEVVTDELDWAIMNLPRVFTGGKYEFA